MTVAVDIPVKSAITITGGSNSITENLEGTISGSIPGYSFLGTDIEKALIESSWDGKKASGSFTKPVKVLIGPDSVLWFLDEEATHMTNIPLLPGELSFKWSLESQELKADFEYFGVERGEITLDASNSSGNIQKYLWSFEATNQALPEGLCFDNSVRLEGKSVKVILLAPTKVKLTVIDDKGQKNVKELEVPISPRKWKTPCTHGSQNIGPLTANVFVASNGEMPLGINWGRNVCALCKVEKEEGAIYHPSAGGPNGNSFDSSGYIISEVSTGPFTGTLDHEFIHTQLLQEALQEFDPAKDLEGIFSEDRNQLRDKADSLILQKEADLFNRFNDEDEVRRRLYQKYKNSHGILVFKNEGQGGEVVYKV